ncbi:MAG: hypothetical protein GF350_15865 [Chitinivibrionales bacterium]|nr:hypothetical protein [Chitinivibrionales bacterium]
MKSRGGEGGKSCAFLLAALIAWPVAGQAIDSTASKNFTTRNSLLPSNSIHCIALDGFGTLWVGTRRGLVRYNGTVWSIHDRNGNRLPSTHILSLLEDRRGRLWVGTYGNGVFRYDGRVWEVFYDGNSKVPDNDVWCLALTPDGAVNAGTLGGGIAVFDNETWSVIDTNNSDLPSNLISHLLSDRADEVWIGTRDHGHKSGALVHRSGGRWTKYDSTNSKISHVECIGRARDGAVMVGTWGAGVAIWKDGNLSYRTAGNSALPGNFVWAIDQDTAGNLWIGTLGKGLACMSSDTCIIYDSSNTELPLNSVRALYLDEQNATVWAGTPDKGIVRLEGVIQKHRPSRRQDSVMQTGGPDNYRLHPPDSLLYETRLGGPPHMYASHTVLSREGADHDQTEPVLRKEKSDSNKRETGSCSPTLASYKLPDRTFDVVTCGLSRKPVSPVKGPMDKQEYANACLHFGATGLTEFHIMDAGGKCRTAFP